jgi:hypothetical protein
MAYTSAFAEALAQKGHQVFFFALASLESSDLSEISKHPNLVVYRWYPASLYRLLNFLFKVARKAVSILLQNKAVRLASGQKLLFRIALNQARIWLDRNCPKLDFCIGIEKGGLLCAAHLFETRGIPYYYYSLELYTRDYPSFDFDPAIPLMRVSEGPAHASSLGTIIQDKHRAAVLYDDTGVDPSEVPALYFPITIATASSLCLQSDRLVSTARSRKRLINFGNHRLKPDQIALIAKNLPDGYTFFIHNISVDELKKIVTSFSLEKVELSSDKLSEAELMYIISQGRIGLCWYDGSLLNNRLTAFSSEKLVRYLSLGLPIIANAETNFTDLFADYECGIAVNGPGDIPSAIQDIERRYEYYSKNSLRAFCDIYDFQKNFDRLELELVTLAQQQRPLLGTAEPALR